MTTRPTTSPIGRRGAKPDAGAASVPIPASSRPKRRKHVEEDLQRAVVTFLRKSLAGNTVFFHTPNGGKRGFLEAKRFRAMGVLAGMVDLGVINDGRLIGIELKAPKGRVSDAQAWCHRQLRQAGTPIYVCTSLGEVIAALRESGVPMCVEGRFL